MMKTGVLILIASFWVLSGCGPDLSSEYGITALRVGDNEEVYFKREVRGLNYDSLILSANQEPCVGYNEETDYRFPSSDHSVYYRIEQKTLHLYITSKAIAPPNFPSSIRIEQHELLPLEWLKMKEHYKEMGLTFLEVPLNDKLKCK